MVYRYYKFAGAVLETEDAFEAKLDELSRELGERGKLGDRAKLAKTAETGDEPTPLADVERGHVAVSCAQEHIAVVRRISVALQSRGYITSFVTAEVAGSEIDEAVMASKIEDSAVLLYGISQADKDCADCKRMAQYAQQRNVGMVPLMLQAGYRVDGWLGIVLGSNLWFGFYGSTLENAEFESKVEELCRELGERGKRK